jgi:hypothetical protein
MNDEPDPNAPGDDDGLKTVRIAVMVTKADEKAIDDWMFARRIRHGRSEAIRQLLHLGLEYSAKTPLLSEEAVPRKRRRP